MKKQQEVKTEYSIEIADLSCLSELNLSPFLKNKIAKILKNPENRQFSGSFRLYINMDMNIQEAIYHKFDNLRTLRESFKTDRDCI